MHEFASRGHLACAPLRNGHGWCFFWPLSATAASGRCRGEGWTPWVSEHPLRAMHAAALCVNPFPCGLHRGTARGRGQGLAWSRGVSEGEV